MAVNQKQSTESRVEYAYAVIEAMAEAMDKVAVKPELTEHFIVDFLRKMPELVDAVMIMTIPEHRQQIAKLLKSSSRMTAEWVMKMRI